MSHSENDSSRNGHLIYHTSHGSGPRVILIHGLGSSRYDWESLRPALVSAGYQALAVDLPGHGDSKKPADPDFYTATRFYTVLEEWIADLNVPPPYLLVAHSLGGYLSLRYASEHPQNVLGLALIDPLYSMNQTRPLLRYFSRKPDLGIKLLKSLPNGWVDKYLGWDTVSIDDFTLNARLQMIVDINRASPHILNVTRNLIDLTPRLSQIETPALVIWGNKDQTLVPVSFPKLVDKLPQANGRLINGCGHQPHIGRPKLVNAMVLDFLSELDKV